MHQAVFLFAILLQDLSFFVSNLCEILIPDSKLNYMYFPLSYVTEYEFWFSSLVLLFQEDVVSI